MVSLDAIFFSNIYLAYAINVSLLLYQSNFSLPFLQELMLLIQVYLLSSVQHAPHDRWKYLNDEL